MSWLYRAGVGCTLITLNNIYRTDLLMARTRLRLGESLACMVYLHRWNCHKHLAFYSIALGFDVFLFLYFFSFFVFFLRKWDSRMELRVGIGSGWIDIYRITHCQGTLLGLGSRSKGSAKRHRPIDNVVCSLFLYFFPFYLFFFDLCSEETELQAKLSLRLDQHHLQHQCVEFFHRLIIIVILSIIDFYLRLLCTIIIIVVTLTRNFVYLLAHISESKTSTKEERDCSMSKTVLLKMWEIS